MRNVLIYVNMGKDSDFEVTEEIKKELTDLGFKVYIMINDGYKVVTDASHKNQLTSVEEVKNADIYFTICIGGDGTMLSFIRKHMDLMIPVIGLNIGKLGFLTELSLKNYKRVLTKIKDESFNIEERTAIQISVGTERQKKYFAANDAVIGRGLMARLVDVEIYINDMFVDTYLADGIIVSNSTGSTAYNLSAGGPILMPGFKGLIVTPICPHSLRSRPIVVSQEDYITIKVVSTIKNAKETPTFSLDGQDTYQLKESEVININSMPGSIKFISASGDTFFKKLRDKIK